jgi:hypothetical protein
MRLKTDVNWLFLPFAKVNHELSTGFGKRFILGSLFNKQAKHSKQVPKNKATSGIMGHLMTDFVMQPAQSKLILCTLLIRFF